MNVDPRLARRAPEHGEPEGSSPEETAQDGADSAQDPATIAAPAFRSDLERIRFSPYFSRLAAVTQVVSQGAAGQAVHNRLTHTIKVTAVARAIAVSVNEHVDNGLLDGLGGIDPVVVQAAASAHDLGHPPFGHLGERILDRLARSRFGLVDGFEGNAQTFRILTALDVHGRNAGLNLTAAVRAAVLKYPWGRVAFPDPHPSAAQPLPRGAGAGPGGEGSAKFSAYLLEALELRAVRAAYPGIGSWQQTLEASAMDVADDIAYSLHDLDDFHRTGVLQHASIAAEFRTWAHDRAELRARPRTELAAHDRLPGYSLELLRRRLQDKDGWIYADDAFDEAVALVATDLVDGLLAVPFDGSVEAERAIGEFTGRWLVRLRSAVSVIADPHPRSGHLGLDSQAWHEVAVLKFVHQRFVLNRPDLVMYQRGQGQLLSNLVTAFDGWLSDFEDRDRAPRRLVDLVELATGQYRCLLTDAPELFWYGHDRDEPAETIIRRLGRGRGIIDYVAGLTDDRAAATAASLIGSPGRLWDGGGGL
jgi:dGTPase